MFLKNLFKKKAKKIDLTSPWNILWDNWSNGKLEEPYASLRTYSSGINGDGHHCFFDNEEENVEIILKELKKLLSKEFIFTINKAYKAHKNDNNVEDNYDIADDYFYVHEEEINNVLQEYADKTYK